MSVSQSFAPPPTCAPDALVEKLVEVAPPLIRRAYLRSNIKPSNECMRMGRLAYDTLALLGIEFEPMDCIVTAWNAKYEWFRETGIDDARAYRHSNDPRLLAKAKCDVSGEHHTHLVVRVPATEQIVDLDAVAIITTQVWPATPEGDLSALVWRGTPRDANWVGHVSPVAPRPRS